MLTGVVVTMPKSSTRRLGGKRLVFAVLVLPFLVLTTGCESGKEKQTGGFLVGAALGGLLGSQIGGGSGAILATGTGIFLGALIGGGSASSWMKRTGLKLSAPPKTPSNRRAPVKRSLGPTPIPETAAR
jgi:hypothetical protein